MRAALSGSIGLCVCLALGEALADTTTDATAAALFRKGRELVEKGDWDKGCEHFRASLARMESASIVLNVARCEEHFGRVASAWAFYQRGLALARGEPGDKRREALERVASDGIRELEPRLPRLRVEAKTRPPGLELREGGRPFPSGEAIPLDPGRHEIVASAPGFAPARHEVVLEEGKTSEIVVELQPVAPASETRSPPPAAERLPAPRPAEPDQPRGPSTEGGVPTWAWIVGGAGLVLTGAAIGFALDARAASDSLERKCGSDLDCDEDPSFDPGPTNARKNRGIGLGIGLGSAGLVAIGASIFGIASAPSSAGLRPTLIATGHGIWLGADLRL